MPDGVWPETREVRSDEEPMGRPMSAAEEVRRAFPVEDAARLNICGILALLRELAVPSIGWLCWYASNSARSAFRERRNSMAFEELRSSMVGSETPRRRYEVARRASRRCSKEGSLLRSDLVKSRVWNQYTRPSCLWKLLAADLVFDLKRSRSTSCIKGRLTLSANSPE